MHLFMFTHIQANIYRWNYIQLHLYRKLKGLDDYLYILGVCGDFNDNKDIDVHHDCWELFSLEESEDSLINGHFLPPFLCHLYWIE